MTTTRRSADDGAIALTGVVTAFLLLSLLIPVLLGVIGVLGTHQRAQIAADAAALALIGESPTARLQRLLDHAEPPVPTTSHSADGPDHSAEEDPPQTVPPTPSSPVHDLTLPSAAALDLARQVAAANGATLVEIDAAGWPNEVLVTVHATPAGPAASLWDGIEVMAAAALRLDD